MKLGICVFVLVLMDICELFRSGLVLAGSADSNNYCGNRFKDIPESEMTEEQMLLYRLMRGYDSATRPVFQANKPVVIRLGISLTQVLDVDEKNQILTTNVWLDQEWIDERLVWENVTQFSMIKMIRIPCDLIWLPDIVLYNSVDNHNKGYMKSLAMVESSGNVFWPPIVRMRSSCKMDITYFPFDDQICKLKLGSWAYDGFQVDVTNRTVDIELANFVDNGEWTLIDTKVKRNVIFYPCCVEPFPDVTFYIHLRRRVLYYFFNVVIPCMLLSSLTLTGFCLPPDSGEKVTLGLTVLLAFSVFMLLIAENMPPTSEYVPLIGIYLTIIMAMSALSVVFSVFVLNFHHRGGCRRGPPRWLKSVALLISRILCSSVHFSDNSQQFTSQSVKYNSNHNHHHHHHNHHHSNNDYKTLLTNEIRDIETTCPPTNGYSNNTQDPNNPSQRHIQVHHKQSCTKCSSLEEDILRYFNKVLSGYERSAEEMKSINDWQEVARMMDKSLFVLFLMITVCATFVLLVICPMGKNIDIESSMPNV